LTWDLTEARTRSLLQPHFSAKRMRALQPRVEELATALLDDLARQGPEDFDITRDAPPHLAFGHGAHYCIGAPLARIELQAVFSQLPARFPAMRLTVPAGQLPRRSGALTGGLTALPVEW
jgi:pentalenolactone synthase